MIPNGDCGYVGMVFTGFEWFCGVEIGRAGFGRLGGDPVGGGVLGVSCSWYLIK